VGLPVDLTHLPLLALPTTVGALTYYAIDTGLVAAAISLSSGARLLPTWRLRFQWLAGHYLGLCVMGLFLAIAAAALGPAGLVVFALPVLMMRVAQQQYVAQTQDSVRELERMNGELARANAEIIATSRAERVRLERAALTDSLTELGNHRAFQEALHRESGRARRLGETVTLARLDIDEFKLINDQHGHGQGDRILAALAAVLRSGRAADQAFRLGGDEFALLLPHTSGPEAVTVMERLRQDARRRLFGATVSVGVAALEPGSHDVDTLQEQAEAALYEAKRRGRDAVVTFTEIQDRVSILSPAKVQTVRRLLAEGHVRVAFQPIWDLQRGGIVAFEALARPAPDYGFAGPQEAFDIAERIGHAHDLDAVCRQAILARAAELPPDTLLFLNVSPQTLDHGLLAGTTLVEAVTAVGLTPERVVLELTERSVARLQVVVREAARLRSLGFKLALDDTGAGNAGLEMLSQVPVDVVKIDRGVVVKALTDRAARGVLAGIVAIARETDTYVIAEGIEDQAMLDLVRRVGVRAGSVQEGVQGVQGYLLGRPSEAIPAPTAVETYRTLLQAA
jgi:diguanylate cyclase (GGDEF)-like protein